MLVDSISKCTLTKTYQRMIACALIIWACLAAALPVHAQSDATEAAAFRLGVYVSPPFVMKEGEGYTGMAVNLWEGLASAKKLNYTMTEYPTLQALVQATAAGQVDAAITNLTITHARAEIVDFTHPWFDAGFRIMVSDNAPTGIGNIIAGLGASGYLCAYAWIALVILLCTGAITIFDRHFNKEFPTRWRDGIAENFYTTMSIATTGRPPARKNLFGRLGRIWSALWLACGIAVLAYVTSSVTSVMTTLSLKNHINSLSDLPGKNVGVFTGSTAEDFVRASGIKSQSYPHIDEAVAALNEGDIDAIVADAPVLEYYAHHNSDKPVSVVGNIFEPEKYAFAFPLESELSRSITVDIIGPQESGLLQDLRTKYFGAQ